MNFTNFLEILMPLPIKRKYKNCFYPYIWPAIDIAGRHIDYLLYKVVKHFQN